ncbi:hypothetical protein MXC99_11525 [Thauera aromatica]|uniref:hypothetical protein n=1 Tax=Thauera aromatica TaxID=59405 RepID=UPI001FFC685D|nr:hypothetical protein [Thauera aromatica]MCK2088801.1 hypothetical protein [Thauera aromatica]
MTLESPRFFSGPVPESFVRRMTATPAGFERELRMAWPALEGGAAQGRFRLRDGELVLEIEVEAAGVRRLGLLELPQLHVRYRFTVPGVEPARRALLSRLDNAMRKGGG